MPITEAGRQPKRPITATEHATCMMREERKRNHFPAHLLLRHLPAGPQSESNEQLPPGELAHLPLRHFPPPQSESNEQEPSAEFEHLPLRHFPPPQSESNEQLPPAEVAHLPLRHFTPAPQSESKLHLPLESAQISVGESSNAKASRKP